MRYAISFLGAVVAVFVSSVVDPTDSGAATTDGYVTTCGGGSLYLGAYEKRTLQLHNDARTSRGLGQLCVHSALTRAARAHSREMMDKDYMSHNNSYNGETAGARLRRFGYDWRAYAENIGWGSGYRGAPEYHFRAWMNSPGHRANILNKNLREVGIVTATGYFGGYANSTTYTVDFGSRR